MHFNAEPQRHFCLAQRVKNYRRFLVAQVYAPTKFAKEFAVALTLGREASEPYHLK
jgi:hypothetical protein